MEKRKKQIGVKIKRALHNPIKDKNKSCILPIAGFTLVEVLLAAVIGSIVALGSLKVFDASLQSSRMANMFFAERELKAVVGKVLSTTRGCQENLKPDRLTDVFFGSAEKGIGNVQQLRTYYMALDSDVSDSDHKTYSLVAGPSVLKTGSIFNGHLEIIQIRLDSIPSFTVSKMKINRYKNLEEDTDVNTHSDNRRFVIFYKKKNMKQLSTIAGGSHCERGKEGEEAKVEDCYFIQCDVRYKLNSSGSIPSVCEMQTCLYAGLPTSSSKELTDDFLKEQKKLQKDLKHVHDILSLTKQEMEKARTERDNLQRQLKDIKMISADRFKKLIDILLKFKNKKATDN